MKKYSCFTHFLFTSLLMMFILYACQNDNYQVPESYIHGSVLDQITGTTIQTQSPNGTRIRLYENSETSSQPINFWCKPDGSFNNERVFSGSYRVIAEGPFLQPDTLNVQIPSATSVDFLVEPFLRINASASLQDSSATLLFSITRSDQWQEKLNRYVILYSTTQSIDVDNYITIHVEDVSELDDANTLGQEISYTIEQVKPNLPVYVRVASRTEGTSYYNYSPIMRLN